MKRLVEVTGAAFGYEGRAIVSGVDLTVDAGDFLGLVGPNGAGKTTLFRGILGLVRASSGRVVRLTDRIGYVPQRESLDPIYPLTVEEVVQMGAYGRLSGWRGLAAAERVLARASLERVGLADRMTAPFASLSGGQRQRALLARALMARPEIVLLDEPTSGVDARARAGILELLSTLNRGEGLAIVLVSHQLGGLRAALTRCARVADGAVREGPLDEVLALERAGLEA